MVIWVVGLSGAGKSTLAEEVVKIARVSVPNVVLVDGDVVRRIFGNDLGHSLEDRRANAFRISRLCAFLEDEGVHVVCAILSIFADNRRWNREHMAHYYQVFIDAPMDQLITRDSKNLYRRAQVGETQDVVGVDIPFERPEDSDLIIPNVGERRDLLAHAPAIARLITGAGA